jgi:hypothetical protein
VPMSGSLRITGDGRTWPYNSDPVVAIANDGTVYFSNLYFSDTNANGLYVSVSNTTTPAPTAAATYGISVNPSTTSTISEDKQWIAVDNSNSVFSGNVYVSWTRFTNTNMVVFSRSSDQGQTWSAPIQVSNPAFNGAVQGSQIAVGPDGAIYIAYHVAYVGSHGIQWIHKSTNGGLTWTAAAQATPQYSEPAFNSNYRKNSFCQMVVNQVSGQVCMVYPDQPSRTAGAEARFVRTTTPGNIAAWTAPLTINDVSKGNQFFPALAVDEFGHLHARWVDTRNNTKSNSILDCYASRSVDGGTTWSANTRLSAASWSVGTNTFIGDYSGIAATNGFAHPIWTTGLAVGGRVKTKTIQ